MVYLHVKHYFVFAVAMLIKVFGIITTWQSHSTCMIICNKILGHGDYNDVCFIHKVLQSAGQAWLHITGRYHYNTQPSSHPHKQSIWGFYCGYVGYNKPHCDVAAWYQVMTHWHIYVSLHYYSRPSIDGIIPSSKWIIPWNIIDLMPLPLPWLMLPLHDSCL